MSDVDEPATLIFQNNRWLWFAARRPGQGRLGAFCAPLPLATVMNGHLDLVSLRFGLNTIRIDMVMLAGNQLPGIY
jgi:hypothetical protein